MKLATCEITKQQTVNIVMEPKRHRKMDYTLRATIEINEKCSDEMIATINSYLTIIDHQRAIIGMKSRCWQTEYGVFIEIYGFGITDKKQFKKVEQFTNDLIAILKAA